MTYATTRTSPGARDRSLPDGDELARLRALPKPERPTFQDIADRYGVSRQAVHKALKRWQANNNPDNDDRKEERP